MISLKEFHFPPTVRKKLGFSIVNRHMKRVMWLISIFLILLPQTGPAETSPVQSPQITFPNSGFEADPTAGLNGWIWPASEWTWEGSNAHSGIHSARVYRGAGNATASLWSAILSVNSSTIYTFTYWLRTQDATYWPSVSIYQYSGGLSQTGLRLIAHANIHGGLSDWNLVSYRFQTMPNAASIQVRIYLPIATGTFWFDDFGLDQGPQAVYPFHPGFPVVASGSVFYSSPVVADINNDGENELLVAGGSAVNGWDLSGTPLPDFPLETGDLHIQSQLALADLDGDLNLEIVAGTKTAVADGQGRVFIWRHNGTIPSGWPKNVAWNTEYGNNVSLVSTVAIADIEGDQDFEILAGTSNNTANYSGSNPPASPNLYAWHADGSLVVGQWPTWHNTAGLYGSIAVGDLNGDGIADIEVGRDHHFLNAYASNGSSLSNWPIETYLNGNSGRYDIDEHIDYPLGAPVIADLDNDGEIEYIVSGFVGGPGGTPLHNSALVVLASDGTRRAGWETPALGNGILNPYDISMEAPAIADLDGDSHLEIIVSTNDGWIRAYNSDKSILWAFDFAQGTVLGATEPAIGDIDGDGNLDILFGTRVPSQLGGIYYSGPVGLWALKSDGTVMAGFPLPVPTPGMFGAPTLADFNNDNKLEILAAAREGQIFIWDTTTTIDRMRLAWPTGRHDIHRSASYTTLMPLEASHKLVSPHFTSQGQTATFTIHIISTVPIIDMLSLTDVIPTEITFIPGTLKATSGVATESGGVIYWNGNLSDKLAVEISYDVVVTSASSLIIQNVAILDTVTNGLLTRSANLYINFERLYMPAVKR